MSSELHSVQPLLRVSGVRKSFGGAVALGGVDLRVTPGERHAIVGENGAGKSTLMRIIAGIVEPDDGVVAIDDEPITFTPAAARAAGVALVHQELSLVPTLDVAENISLGAQPTRNGFILHRERRRRALLALERLQVRVDPDELVTRLSLAERQFVEIAKALLQEPKLLILDEPSSALTPRETDELFAALFRLVGEGMTLLYISHRIPEVFALCTSITVLRDGLKVADLDVRNSTPDQVIQLMVGRELAKVDRELRPGGGGEPVLTARGIRAPKVEDMSLEVRSGEVVGIAGLVGAGRSELVRAILGLDRRDEGEVVVGGGNGAASRIHSFRDAVRHGVAFAPEDRRVEGVALNLSIASNAALPSLSRLSPRGALPGRRVHDLGLRVVEKLDIRPPQPRRLVGTLSGGNQQKVALGKWLDTRPRVLVLDEPTRGVDVGAKADIHQIIRSVADEGTGVLVVSSDLPELLALCDRILVMRDGRIRAEVSHDEATEEVVMQLAAGEEPQ